MKKALVFGGAGFIGSHLSAELLKDDYYVIVVDNLYTGTKANIPEGVEFLERDVTALCAADFPKVDEIYNLACPASPVHYQARPIETALTSIKGVLLSLEIAKRDKAKMLHASTSEIYGDPIKHPQEEYDWGNVNTIGWRSCYDEGKRVAETLVSDYVRLYDVDARTIRIFNTYGPNMLRDDGRVISNFIVQALKGEDITIYGEGTQTRSFQYVTDLVNAVFKYMAIEKSELRRFFASVRLPIPVLNIGNPEEYTIKRLAKEVLRLIPESSSRLVFKALPSDDPKKRRPDITLAKKLLDWEPVVSLESGLKETISYFKR